MSFIQLQIKNFKGILNGNYTFKENGTVLMSGKSGIGKSSILDAIQYVICGDNSRGLANMSSDGKICVKLTFKHLQITRTNKPKKLELIIFDKQQNNKEEYNEGDNKNEYNDEGYNKNEYNDNRRYEDEHAQSYIDSFFTSFFKDVGYIRQKGALSILQKTSTERMEFLRLWITNDKSIQKMKTNLKQYQKTVNDKCDKINIELQVAQKILENIDYNKIQSLKISNPINHKNPRKIQILKNIQYSKTLELYNTQYERIKYLRNVLKHKDVLFRKYELDKLFKDIDINKIKYENKILCDIENIQNELEKLNDNNNDNDNEVESITQLKKQLDNLQHQKIISEMNQKNTKRIIFLKNKINNKNLIISKLHNLQIQLVKHNTNIQKNIEEYEYYLQLSKEYNILYNKLSNCVASLLKIDGVTNEDNCEFKLIFTSHFFNCISLNINCPSCNSFIEIVDSDKLEVKLIDTLKENCKINDSVKNLYIEYNKYYSEYLEIMKKCDNLNFKYYSEQIKLLKEIYNNNLNDITIIKNTINLDDNNLDDNNLDDNNLDDNNLDDNNNRKQLINEFNSILQAENELANLNINDNDNDNDSNINYEYEIQKLKDLIEVKTRVLLLKNKLHELRKNIKNNDILLHKQYNDNIIEQYNEYISLNKIKLNLDEEKLNNYSDDYFRKIENEYIELKQECVFLYAHIEELQLFKENVKKYLEYAKQKNEYIMLKNNFKNLTEKYNKYQNLKFNCIKLKMLIEKTESNMIDRFIYDLNDKIQSYVDKFFTDDIMSFDLRCVKDKQEQSKLSFNIIYKGNVIDDVKCLSGGEYDRLNLAISLAFGDILELPLMMFDESVNSLDESSCANVLEHIKNPNRLTLIVAHQIEEGLFDDIIKIN